MQKERDWRSRGGTGVLAVARIAAGAVRPPNIQVLAMPMTAAEVDLQGIQIEDRITGTGAGIGMGIMFIVQQVPMRVVAK